MKIIVLLADNDNCVSNFIRDGPNGSLTNGTIEVPQEWSPVDIPKTV